MGEHGIPIPKKSLSTSSPIPGGVQVSVRCFQSVWDGGAPLPKIHAQRRSKACILQRVSSMVVVSDFSTILYSFSGKWSVIDISSRPQTRSFQTSPTQVSFPTWLGGIATALSVHGNQQQAAHLQQAFIEVNIQQCLAVESLDAHIFS